MLTQLSRKNRGNYHISGTYLPRKQKRKFNPINLVIIMVFTLALMSLPLYLYNEIVILKHKKAIEYLEKIGTYEENGHKLIQEFAEKRKNTSKILYVNEIQIAKIKLQNIMYKLQVLEAPPNFSVHKQTFTKLIEHQFQILSYLETSKKSYIYHAEEWKQLLQVLNNLNELERISLIGALDEAGISYHLESDGIITYRFIVGKHVMKKIIIKQ